MSSLNDYAIPVHRSLQEPDIILGVGQMALLLLVTVTILLATMLSFWCVFIGIAAFIVLRFLCKDDPYLVDILIANLSLPDRYIG